MELKEFITETLSQIIDGVSEVQERYKDKNVIVNPDTIVGSSKDLCYVPDDAYKYKTAPLVQFIEMDVALTVTENAGSKAGIGIAKVLNVGAATEENKQNSTISKVKFNIPICLPTSSSTDFIEKITTDK